MDTASIPFQTYQPARTLAGDGSYASHNTRPGGLAVVEAGINRRRSGRVRVCTGKLLKLFEGFVARKPIG